jgi:hypothetical protein
MVNGIKVEITQPFDAGCRKQEFNSLHVMPFHTLAGAPIALSIQAQLSQRHGERSGSESGIDW